MYEGKALSPSSLAPSQTECKVPSRGLQVLADDFEKTMMHLREEVMSLNGMLNPALRPEPPTGEDKVACNEPVRAPLESWLYGQLSVARSCIERLQSYRERCVL